MKSKSTTEQAEWLEKLHDHFNEWIFAGLLPDCMIGISDRQNITDGYFRPRKLTSEKTQEITNEIWLNREILDSDICHVYLALIHQQIRAFIYTRGDKPSQGYGYHDRQFVDVAELRGLDCAGTGKDGGKKTGWNVELKFVKGGLAMKALEALPEELRAVPFKSRSDDAVGLTTKPKKRVEVACFECGWKGQFTKRDSQIQYCPACTAEYLRGAKLKPTLFIKGESIPPSQ